MVDGKCSRGYPRAFLSETMDSEDGYPWYRRSEFQDAFVDGKVIQAKRAVVKGKCVMDNGWVVPYNPWLSQKYDAHINVEVVASVKAVKYLYK